ncbi:hydrogenase subunit MbhD domain-containing protein, partial [Methanospirillum sp.]
QAPDVAIAEAAVGAGISTAIFLIAIRATHDQEAT